MREMKFRAWDKEQKIMLSEQSLKILIWGDGSYTVRNWYEENKGKYEYEGQGNDDCILMQYTGLKDKNGKEVYEGDIIQVGAGVLFSAKLTVEFIKYSWCLTAEDYIDTFNNTKPEHIKVIGNIYEHSELLESGKK